MNTFNVLVATGAKVEFYIERSLFNSCGMLVHHDNRPLTTVGQTNLTENNYLDHRHRHRCSK